MFDVTMTFDNGPDPRITPYVLDVLKERGIAASFFVVGQQFETSGAMDACERAYDDGHWIGNHTYTHSTPLGERLDDTVVADEIIRTHKLIRPFIGHKRLFRPFGYGGSIGRHLLSPSVRDYLFEQQYTCVLWNALPRDWENRDTWDKIALHQCRSQPWSVVVVHDLPIEGSIKRLPHFLDAVLAEGGRFRQDFPVSCTPIWEGVAMTNIDNLVGPPDA
ncbi:peptidoglycan/xylan/chitin deacetylase (PgdA/CDA1 family) [Paraburkholderia sp. MM5496-R1]|uniref:polysaccharide deacetylase family protein n=1 Tax=unclassified Paraburkholderia TaxID=2615204 RepID=UPI003D1CF088